MVAAVHTASSDLQWHPHVQALVSRGGWDKDGIWYPVAYVDTRAAELLFRHKVIAFLTAEDLLDDNRIELLDSWMSGHTGFSAHNALTVQAYDGGCRHGGIASEIAAQYGRGGSPQSPLIPLCL